MTERLRRLEPGVYTDAATNTMHLDLPEFARAHGVEPTPANIATLEAAARSIFEEQGMTVEVREHGDPRQQGEQDAPHEP